MLSQETHPLGLDLTTPRQAANSPAGIKFSAFPEQLSKPHHFSTLLQLVWDKTLFP